MSRSKPAARFDVTGLRPETPPDASPAAMARRKSSNSGTASALSQGLALTVVFYLTVPRIPVTQTFVARYFCGHPVEYVGTLMFVTGLLLLWRKFRSLGPEKRALDSIHALNALPEFESATASRSDVIHRLQHWISSRSNPESGSALVRRIDDTLHYVKGRKDGGLEEHLRYLADLAADRMHQSYALLRTITWAIPILGFLGTVMGITIAIANVTPEQLDSSLPEVTAGLAVAFDTTAQALAMSILLVFGSFLVERGEQSVLNDVEQFGIDQLLSWLPDVGQQPTADSGPQVLIAEWTSALQQQAQSWGQLMSELQAGWSHTLTAQTARLNAALNEETQSTLQMHRGAMEDARDAYTQVLHQSTQQFAQQLHQSLDGFSRRVDVWQEAMKTSSLASAGQMEELHRFGRTLLQMTESEQQLARLQQQLNDNLQSLKIVDTLEQTVSSLNAAVHVLTAKTHFRSAA